VFSVHQGRILVLHGFVKKAQKTPDEDMALARRRKREFVLQGFRSKVRVTRESGRKEEPDRVGECE
jgi:hypothetical protein